MKNTPILHFIFLNIILGLHLSSAQQNIVPNPSFEGVGSNFSCPGFVEDVGGNPIYFDWSNINGWTHPDCHSLFPCGFAGIGLGYALWKSYYCNGINRARTGSAWAEISAYLGNDNSSGQYGYITTRLTEKLKTGHKYYIEYYIKPTQNYTPYGMSISALLTLQKPEQKREYRIQTSVDFQGVYVTPTTFNGNNWLKVSGSFYASNEYEWLTLGCFDLSGNVDSYVNGNFDIDDVSLIEKHYCNAVCSPNLPHVTEALNSGSQFNVYPNAMVASGNPWHIYVANAIGIDFTVFSSASNEFYHAHAMNVNGLKDVGFSDYLFLWTGKNDFGNYVQQDVYNYKIRIWNCTSEINHLGSITYLRDGNDFPQPPYVSNQDLNDCCPSQLYIQNKQYAAVTNELAHNFIIAGTNVTAGTTGPVVVNSGAKVRYVSNTIELKPGFSVSIGGDFKAIATDDCPFGSALKIRENTRPLLVNFTKNFTESDILTDTITNSRKIIFYPNPSQNGIFYLKNLQQKIDRIEVYNALGELIMSNTNFEQTHLLDLTTQKSGIYLCKIYTKDALPVTTRICKAE